MKTVRIAIFALTAIFVAGAILSLASFAQTTRRRPRPHTDTILQARLFSGDFAEWGLSTDISSPHAVTFRWGSKQAGAVKAYYQVSEEDLGFDTTPDVMQKTVWHSNLGTIPAPDHVMQFEINFASFAPATPPASTKTYFVRVVTLDDKDRIVGAPSMSAQVYYSAPNAPVKFGGAGSRPRPGVPPVKH
jgi:hypothetical protein